LWNPASAVNGAFQPAQIPVKLVVAINFLRVPQGAKQNPQAPQRGVGLMASGVRQRVKVDKPNF
jgi:hypothetical protein